MPPVLELELVPEPLELELVLEPAREVLLVLVLVLVLVLESHTWRTRLHRWDSQTCTAHRQTPPGPPPGPLHLIAAPQDDGQEEVAVDPDQPTARIEASRSHRLFLRV